MAPGVVFAMIANPINMKRKRDKDVAEHFSRTSDPFFYIIDNLIGLLKSPREPLWSIAHRVEGGAGQYYEPGYYIGLSTSTYSNRRTRDEMMELLETEYQDYLEWLIWNPGWL